MVNVVWWRGVVILKYSLDRNWPELRWPCWSFTFTDDLTPGSQQWTDSCTWRDVQEFWRIYGSISLSRISLRPLGDTRKVICGGQMKRAELIVKIDCKRQFTSELMKLRLPIRVDVPDGIAFWEDTEHSRTLRPWFRPQSSTLKIDPGSSEYLGCLKQWPTLPKLSS